MMDVKNNKLRGLFILTLYFFSVLVTADEGNYTNDIKKFLLNNIAHSTAELGKSIKACSIIKNKAKPIELSNKKIKKFGVTTNNVIVALSHLSYANTLSCERSARLNLAYDVGFAIVTFKQLGLNVSKLNDIQETILYPPTKQLQLAMKFSKLPINFVIFMQTKVGKEPFDLIQTLQANNLLK